MTRRWVLGWLAGVAAAAAGLRGFLARAGQDVAAAGGDAAAAGEGDSDLGRLELPAEQWRGLLEPMQFAVLREEATERSGTSPLDHEKRAGSFVCAGCFAPLFLSAQKFDSGTGWPSFFDVIAKRVATHTDYKLVLPRTEYHCARCGGHQGHVFKDGPQPTGLRYCNNGVALRFVPEGEEPPPLRQA